MTIEALIFDKDGTLFDFADTWESFSLSFLLRLAQGDAARAAELGACIGFDYGRGKFAPDSILIASTPSEIAAELAPELPSMALDDIIDMMNDEASAAPQAQAVPLAPFLSDLRGRGLKLGVATNDAEEPALAHLDGAGVRHLFDFIAGFDSGHGAKPGPGQLLAFAEQIGVQRDRIAMVGDSTHDLIAGRSAGMKTVGVLTGMALEEELAPHADVVMPDIGSIPAWLGL